MLTKVAFWGGASILNEEPDVIVVEDAIFVPKTPGLAFEHDLAWGLYDAHGRRVEAAALRRGAAGSRLGGSEACSLDGALLPEIAETVIYGGAINLHFGHFICSSLSRLWYANRVREHRVVFHADHDCSELMKLDYVSTCFSGSGIDERRGIRPNKPVRLRRVIVPGSAFEEQFQSNRIFRTFCLNIGERYQRAGKTRSPIYISKTRLKHGVSRIVNEAIVEEVMQRRGVEIVYPETLNFADQIGLFWENRPVLGSVGSAFHSHIFARGEAPMVAMQAFGEVNSNFAMIDGLANRCVTYITPRRKSIEDTSDPHFLLLVTLADPIGVAGGMLAHL